MPFASVLKQFKATKKRARSSSNSSMVNSDDTSSELLSTQSIIAKNSMVFPVIMRDINVMKQGILKLVKLAGGTQRDQADRFFLKSADRENAYESQVASNKSNSPSKVGDKKSSGQGFFGGANDFLNAIIGGGLTNMLIKGGLITGILYAIGKFFTSSEFRTGIFDMIGKFGATVFGEEGWKDVKKNIVYGSVILLAGIVAIKTALSAVVAGLAYLTKKLFGFGGVSSAGAGGAGGKGGIGRAFRGIGLAGVGLGLYNMFSSSNTTSSDGEESSGFGGVAAAATGLAVGSALNNFSTPKTSIEKPTTESSKKPQATNQRALLAQQRNSGLNKTTTLESTTKWSKFLAFVERKAPKLYAKVGLRLLSAGAGLAIPGPGWIWTAISILGSVTLAWELYGLWKEFNGTDESKSGNSPQKVDDTEKKQSLEGWLSGLTNQTPISMVGFDSKVTGTTNSPSRSSPTQVTSSGGGNGMTFNQLSREQQDALMTEQRKQEGFKPGSLSYDLNNPGNIQYGEFAKKYGGERDTTGRGVGSHKGTFARFPTLAQGVEAQRALWSSKNYGNLPLEQALKRWAPDSGSNYSQSIIAAATSGKSTPVVTAPAALTAQTQVSGSQLNSHSSALENSKRNSSSAPVVINAPTTNNNGGGNAGGTISLPASGVVDLELTKLLVERAIG